MARKHPPSRKRVKQGPQKQDALAGYPRPSNALLREPITVEPRYNDLRYNDIPDIAINIFQPGQRYSKMYGTKPRFNYPRYNDIPDITTTI